MGLALQSSDWGIGARLPSRTLVGAGFPGAPLWKRAISFCSCKKKWQKKKHVQGGHAIVSPLKIPPPGGSSHLGGASRRFYCPVRR